MDEEADLALLDQHLLKTNLLSQRMTNILGQLDNRLSRLDKTIAPLGLQPLTRKDANIQSILLQMEGPGRSSASTPTSSKPPNSISALAPIRPARNIPVTSPINTSSIAYSNGAPTSAVSTSTKPSSVSSSPVGGGVTGYTLGNPIITNLKSSAHANSNSNEKAKTSTLSPIQSAAPSIAASPADETAILVRGPDIMALNEYFTAIDGVILDLERMYKGLMEGRGGAREMGVKDLSNLVEIGFSGMTQLFLKLSKDGMGKTVDAESVLNNGPPTPPNYFPPLNTLLPLLTKINSILYPANPTPKTASIVQPIWDQTIATFGDMRGDWLCRCLSGLITRVEESDEGGIWAEGRGREKVQSLLGCWESLLSLVEAETLLITTLFPSNPPSSLLLSTLHAPTETLIRILQPTINTIKRSLSTHIFLALDLYRSLSTIQSTWDTIISKCLSMTNTPSSLETKDMLSILNQPISTLRSLSLRSFPELLVDIKSSRADGSPSSSIADTTYSTLGYLENMNGFEKLIEGLLSKSHSERSWLMGQKEPPSSARNANEEGGVVNLFVADVLGTLLQFLDARSRTMRKPVGQAFLLNNLSHIRNTTSSFKSDITGPGAEDMLNKAFRDAKGQYLSEFHSLVSLLTTTHSTPRFGVTVPQGERHHLKESATQFFDKLAELENVIMQYPLNRQDPDMRDRISREVEGIVRGGYEAFWARCAGRGIEKYLRGSPDDITRRVQAMFR
ncbi:uncharacterized protein I303_103966 [Kwoniella dejecticola CBS 10117]|uniref:Exocyst complex protein EXO70 n=1 Tax=Kwoniella dejecticola CBS 10117 TaxID=1296121 RepID=A0A1A6A879_9TREE|nr:uncharacterized protein I303_03984 [Kwoniella dejecticola CBS 10117]OBR86262.1 hypothetical protein I303_03984 [Kwoniella dejecticola CBS 10117]